MKDAMNILSRTTLSIASPGVHFVTFTADAVVRFNAAILAGAIGDSSVTKVAPPSLRPWFFEVRGINRPIGSGLIGQGLEV